MGLRLTRTNLLDYLYGSFLYSSPKRLRHNHHGGLRRKHKVKRTQKDVIIEIVRREEKVLKEFITNRIG